MLQAATTQGQSRAAAGRGQEGRDAPRTVALSSAATRRSSSNARASGLPKSTTTSRVSTLYFSPVRRVRRGVGGWGGRVSGYGPKEMAERSRGAEGDGRSSAPNAASLAGARPTRTTLRPAAASWWANSRPMSPVGPVMTVVFRARWGAGESVRERREGERGGRGEGQTSPAAGAGAVLLELEDGEAKAGGCQSSVPISQARRRLAAGSRGMAGGRPGDEGRRGRKDGRSCPGGT